MYNSDSISAVSLLSSSSIAMSGISNVTIGNRNIINQRIISNITAAAVVLALNNSESINDHYDIEDD